MTIGTKFLSRAEAVGLASVDDVEACKKARVPFGTKVAIVSMISPDAKTDPELNGFFVKTLRLKFHDVDPNHFASMSHVAEAVDEKDLVIFDESHAKLIIEFIEECIEAGVNEIWAHCEAGISRSAAVSKFIAIRCNSSFPEAYSLYNKHVFTTLHRAYVKSMISFQQESL